MQNPPARTPQHNKAQWYLDYFAQHQDRLLGEFFEFLRFKSISTNSAYSEEVKQCANWVASFLRASSLEVEVWPSSRHPIVFAQSLAAGPLAPTVLIYTHYDVQPPEPLEQWLSPPFQPEIRDGEVYARGAQDNKGQCFYVMCALRAMIERYGKYPLNVKIIVEGEEECGSEGIREFLAARGASLQADALLVVDMGFHSRERPAITLGLRGLTHFEIEVVGSKVDLHSGVCGGMAYNPIHALVKILAAARDETGRVLIPGFYQDVAEPSDAQLSQLDLTMKDSEFTDHFGGYPTGGEIAYPPLQRTWLRPTLEVNGICGGYTGEGFKTVIPAKASAKVSCRLVPQQDPKKIAQAAKDYFEAKAPPGITVNVQILPGGGGALHTSAESSLVRVAQEAYREATEEDCSFIYSGGSIPIVPELVAVSAGTPLLLGFGLPEDNIHAPNEHFGVDRLRLGMGMIGSLIEKIAERKNITG